MICLKCWKGSNGILKRETEVNGMFRKQNVQDLYGLSPLQKGMLFHHLHDAKSSAYFEQTTFWIEGEVHVTDFEKSIQKLVERYDIFRTIFLYEKINQPMQVVLKERKPRLVYIDVSSLPPEKQKRQMNEFKNKDREKGFDLTRDQLIRFALFRTSHHQYQLIVSFHHILMDG
jgi:hypothetical protein